MANEKAKEESLSLAEMQEQIKVMLAETKKAKEEAEKLLADAKASVKGELTEEQKKAKEAEDAYWNELVKIKLFKDNDKYKDDVYVAVNGENCVIKRGVEVQVKRKFAHVLDNSSIQDYETSELIDRKTTEFAKSEL